MAALSPPDSAHAIDVCAAEISDMLPLTSIGTIRALCRALAVSIALRKRVPVRMSRSGRRISQPRRYVAETAHAYAVRLEKRPALRRERESLRGERAAICRSLPVA